MAQGEKPESTLMAAFKKVAFHTAIIGVFAVAALYTGVDVTGTITKGSGYLWTSIVGAPAAGLA